MKLHELRSPDGARHRRKRVGRGTGSGHGKTSGRGQKGQNARGQGWRIGFEGGQMPLAQRLPKLGGFKNPFKKQFAVVNLSRLNRFEDGATVDLETLVSTGIADAGKLIKILGAGRLRRRLTVEAHVFSEAARAAIEARSGEVRLAILPGSAAAAELTTEERAAIAPGQAPLAEGEGPAAEPAPDPE